MRWSSICAEGFQYRVLALLKNQQIHIIPYYIPSVVSSFNKILPNHVRDPSLSSESIHPVGPQNLGPIPIPDGGSIKLFNTEQMSHISNANVYSITISSRRDFSLSLLDVIRQVCHMLGCPPHERTGTRSALGEPASPRTRKRLGSYCIPWLYFAWLIGREPQVEMTCGIG